MLAFFSFLSALLWGSFIGAKMHRGYPSTKVHLPYRASIIGNLLFTLPLIPTVLFSPVSHGELILAFALTLVGLCVGILVGITTYWID